MISTRYEQLIPAKTRITFRVEKIRNFKKKIENAGGHALCLSQIIIFWQEMKRKACYCCLACSKINIISVEHNAADLVFGTY